MLTTLKNVESFYKTILSVMQRSISVLCMLQMFIINMAVVYTIWKYLHGCQFAETVICGQKNIQLNPMNQVSQAQDHNFMVPQLNWIEQQPSKLQVQGSNPCGITDGRMMELVDMTDLKSVGQYCPCGFKSHSGYQDSQLSWSEHSAHNGQVTGSSPVGSTLFNNIMKEKKSRFTFIVAWTAIIVITVTLWKTIFRWLFQ